MHPTGVIAEFLQKSYIAEKIRETAAAVVRSLRQEGECKLVWFGKMLEFQLEINTCDIYVDGEWVDSISHYSLVREFLEDIAEVAA